MSGSHAASDRIVATYRLHGPPAEARALAEAIALEQSVELPAAQITDPHVREHVLGRVEALDSVAPEATLATISYTAELGQLHLSQLLNLVYGNVSLYDGVRLDDLALPDAVLERFAGPAFGVEGIRTLLGVHGRPLLATALKPNGRPAGELAALGRDFAAGGGDLVKDDQNLVDDFESFKARTRVCRDAVADGEQISGSRCLYLPHVSAPGPALRRFFDHVCELELAGVLICPFIAGLDTTRALGAEYGLVLMAHPSMGGGLVGRGTGAVGTGAVGAGAVRAGGIGSGEIGSGEIGSGGIALGGIGLGGIEPGLALGTLMRLAGADISVFPHSGGRFSFSEQTCDSIRARLAEPLGALRPALPAPSGGMQFERIGELAAHYGEDAVILIGGGLFGHDPDLRAGTRAFVERIADAFPGAGRFPPVPLPVRERLDPAARHAAFDGAWNWQGRPSSAYKDASDDSFRGVRRVELAGRFGERTHTDLRYFEVEPGGWSSLEQHLHTHVVIGARGAGVLLLGNRRLPLNVNDVAVIEPLEVHQLRNETDAPFGFFCIVDHDRDRPLRLLPEAR